MDWLETTEEKTGINIFLSADHITQENEMRGENRQIHLLSADHFTQEKNERRMMQPKNNQLVLSLCISLDDQDDSTSQASEIHHPFTGGLCN